jgi:hypothetical protein
VKNWIGKKKTSFADVPGWPRPRRKAGRKQYGFNPSTGKVEERRPDDPLTDDREVRHERYWRRQDG